MKKVVLILAIPAFVFLFLAGCSKDTKTKPCTYNACAYQAPAAEIQAVQHYLDSVHVTATQHCSGLFYTITDPGTGGTPEVCNNVEVKYKGMLTNGHVFDSSSVGTVINLAQVIRGWSNGVPLLKQGGKITLYIPPSLGYGNEDQFDPNHPTTVLIPANSILIFDIELIAI